MKDQIAELLHAALRKLQQQNILPEDCTAEIQVDNSRHPEHGDFASNLALQLAKLAGHPPRQMAAQLVDALPAAPWLQRVEIAGPGFLNFFVTTGASAQVVAEILRLGESYGRGDSDDIVGGRVLVEFVSANPTGPLHVGHGRGAAWGDILARLLESAGYQVTREYYVNDAGRQMDILALSVWLRYLELCGEHIDFPEGAYQGGYIADHAREVQDKHGRDWVRPVQTQAQAIQGNKQAKKQGEKQGAGNEREELLDRGIAAARTALGSDIFATLRLQLGTAIVSETRRDLQTFGVRFENWFYESSLGDAEIERAIERLHAANCTEERDGALWFLASRFGDDKDRVLRRSNGQSTYFAADIAYHLNKFERGYDRLINVWGADHHGYVKRIHAALQALGIDPERLEVRLLQLVSLSRDGQPVAMSTRDGSFVTLHTLYTETGVDAARFFYVMRRAEQATEFDLSLARSQERDNPVYYIQYAHARVCSLFRQLREKNIVHRPETGLAALERLDSSAERELILRLADYPKQLQRAAKERAPHLFAGFMRDLSAEFHNCYNQQRVLIEEEALREARLCLAEATRQTIANGLTVLGMSAPQSM